MKTIDISKTPEVVVDKLASHFVSISNNNELHSSAYHVSLSGGSTPKLLFNVLSKRYSDKVNWGNIHFWWGDERCVPPEDPESNFGEMKKLLLSHISIPAENIHRIKGENDPEQEAERYKNEILEYIPVNDIGLPVFDWTILGVGSDGHTASLFPFMVPLDRNVITTVARHPDSGQKRVSMGITLLCASRKVSVLVTGLSKASIIEDIYRNKKIAKSYPIFYVESGCNAMWMLDEQAASKINPP